MTDDYQELSAREENDLEYMMAQSSNAIGNIEAFTEQLSKDLSVLDGVSFMVLKNNFLFRVFFLAMALEEYTP